MCPAADSVDMRHEHAAIPFQHACATNEREHGALCHAPQLLLTEDDLLDTCLRADS